MGYGNYSQSAHQALAAGRSNLSRDEVFQQRGCHALMNPLQLTVRESRDSAEHPASLGIVFALDVTGSMGTIPEALARQELPTFMKLLGDFQVPDPQVMFMALGDANSDDAPLQVGQFETTAELMDQWLTWSYLEGHGGGNGMESYDLAFYVLAQHTDLDCWVKRKKKGYLFMTGDELPYTTTVDIEKFVVDGALRRISAAILVDRPGHKAIIIGSGGEVVKRIASEARQDMERMFAGQVFLEVFVKVKSGWADDERMLKTLGYE